MRISNTFGILNYYKLSHKTACHFLTFFASLFSSLHPFFFLKIGWINYFAYIYEVFIMVSVNEFPIATANEIPGFKIIETKGFVYGLTVRSRGVGGQVSAGLRSLVGGEIKEYVSMMEDSRDEALERLIEHAKQLGGNAIVAVRFDSNDISNVMQEILAYGTAVVVEKEE